MAGFVCQLDSDLGSDDPELLSVFFGDGLKHEVDSLKCLVKLPIANQAYQGVIRKLMDVQGAETHIREVSLTRVLGVVVLDI